MKHLLLFLFIAYTTVSNSQVTSYLDVPYHAVDSVDQNLLSFDAYVPDGVEPKPIIIYVHGGGWVSGDKSVFGEKKKFFTDKGYIFISVNYRLSPIPYELNNPNRIKYPQHPDDVARAVSFILDRVSTYGGDLDKVAIIGHSAGAQIVSLIMTDASFLEAYGHSPEDLKCLCSLDTGGYDLNLWLRSASQSTNALYTNAFSADSIIRRQASPALNVDYDDNLPTTLLVHQNTLKRNYINRLFADSLSKYGAEVMTISSDYSHGEINQKIGDLSDDTSAQYTLEIANWFESCLSTSVSTSETNKLDIHLFPNPASDIVYLSASTNYQLIDLKGQLLLSGYGNQINLRSFNAGIYLLVLRIKGRDFTELLLVE